MRARRGTLAALLTGAAFGGCTEVSTDPQIPLSLQFDSLPALAVVVGDTMRGGDLLPARIPVRVFNSAGQTVSDSQVRLLGIDTASVKAFTSIGGLRLVGKSVNAAVRIVAQAGSLQSQTQTFAVVRAPTGISAPSAVPDSIIYDTPDTAARNRDARVTVYSIVGADTAFLNGLRVRFRVVSFTDSILDSVRMVATGTGRNETSALVTSGFASLRLKAYTKPTVRPLATGIVTVETTLKALGADVPGSPFRFTVKLVPFKL